jgi:transposase-like protein
VKDPTGGISEERPRRWTLRPERARWASAFEASGKTYAEFAREHGLRVPTLRRWVLEQAGDSRPPDKAVELQEISLGQLLGQRDRADVWEAEIRLPSGVVLALAKGTPAARVRELVEAVRC